MARYSEAQGLSISSGQVQNYRNGIPDSNPASSFRYVRDKQINTLTRGDLIRRRADKDGYRQPTPYMHQSWVPGFIAGTYTIGQTWNWAGKTVVAIGTGQVSWTGSDVGGTGSSAHLLDPSISDLVSVPTSVKNAVKSKLRKRIKEEQWNAAVMLREMKDSVNLIASSAKKLQNAMLCAVRKDWKGVAYWLGVPLKKFKDGTKPAEAWLEFHFGWAPIVSDMVGAANFLATVGEHKPRLRVAAGARLKDTGTAKVTTLRIPGGNTDFGGNWPLKQRMRLETLTDYKIICWYELDQGWLRDLAKIGFTNPAELIYNTTAFTWLIEWLIPLGEVLSGLDATIGLKFLSGTETTYQKASLKMVGDPVANITAGTNYPRQRLDRPPVAEFVVRGGSRTHSSRVVLTNTPFPSFLWIENPFSPWRIATSAALMRQLVPGLRSK